MNRQHPSRPMTCQLMFSIGPEGTLGVVAGPVGITLSTVSGAILAGLAGGVGGCTPGDRFSLASA